MGGETTQMESFKAWLTSQDGKAVKTECVDMTIDQLDPGEVVIDVEYSTVNVPGDVQFQTMLTMPRDRAWLRMSSSAVW